MGVNLSRELRIAGYRPSVFRDALRGFLRTYSPGNLVDLKSVFPLRRDGAIVFEECLDRGFIEFRDRFVVPDKGEALARAKTARRTPLAEAQRVLHDFLNRISAFNADSDAVQFVERAWLFGSVMRNEDDVGDIDIALEMERRLPYSTDFDAMERHLERVLSQRKDVPRTQNILWSAEAWLTERTLYGTRRHPLLAGVQSDISNLVSLAVPCCLIYDRPRGGRVYDPVLPAHPKSTGRRPDIKPPSTTLEINPSDIRPMDGRWISGFDSRGLVSPYNIFRGWTDDARKLFPHYPEKLRVFADGYDVGSFPWVPKQLKSDGIDGRGSIVLANATQSRGTSVVLRRKIERQSEIWALHGHFEALEVYPTRSRVHPTTLPDLTSAAALILAVDAERMLRRCSEEHSMATVQIRISDDLNANMRSHFVEAVRRLLKSRAVRVEPVSWTNTAVSIE